MDAADVLAYLNMLGYRNISPQQLKEFIKDLKKLIKHDQQASNYYKFDVTNDTKSNNQELDVNQFSEIRNIFDFLYSQSTVSSEGKKVAPARHRKISVHIRKKPDKTIHNHCIHIEDKIESEDKPPSNRTAIASSDHDQHDAVSSPKIDKQSSENFEELNKRRPLSNQTIQSAPSNAKTSKKGSSRPNSSKQINRSDPVALFQYYQSEWKKQKFPGKENHADVRWAVREKLLGGPPVEIPMTNKTSCRKSVICSYPSLL